MLIFSIKERPIRTQTYYYYLYYYDYDLNKLGEFNVHTLDRTIEGRGLFFKLCHLYDIYMAIVYFIEEYKYIFQILVLTGDYPNFSFHNNRLTFTDDRYYLDYDILLNDLIKIDNNRLVLLSTKNSNELYIILYDLYNWYSGLKVRYYNFGFVNEKISQFSKELSGFIYNEFLTFTATVLPPGSSNSENFFPILMIFGYANGADFEINISPYFIDSDVYSSSINLVNDLIDHLQIDNNIFSYEKVQKIKLISIPQEILFYHSINDILINDGELLDNNYILKQNNNIIKENKYYSLKYQFIVKEPEYTNFYGNAFTTRTEGNISNANLEFEPKIFYGRTNILKFKLCNNNCQACKKFGSNEIGQICESCLPNFKFYKNENNEKICFEQTNSCPEEYHYYNNITKECKNTSISEEIEESTIITIIEQPIIKTNIEKSTIIKNIEKSTINVEEFTIITNVEGTNVKNEINDNCSIVELLYDSCSKLNYTNEKINNKINIDIIPSYNITGGSIEIKGDGNLIYQLTTTNNERKFLSEQEKNTNGLSIVVLGDCEDLLKQENGIDPNLTLIIKKVEQLTISAERNIQYEVYHPINKTKLNLSICEKEIIDIYIPIEIDENLLDLYKDLQSSGYDLFNINDSFYNDLCTPYKSKNGRCFII